MDNFWLKNILIPIILIVPILLFAFSLINLGTDNLRMIYHFDQDEGSLIEFAGKTYSKGIIPLEYNAAYPQFFYYLAGVFLFPFTLLKGINYHVIIVVLRSFNALIVSATVVFLYFFCLRFFKSISIGILSSLLLVTTPGYMSWIINSRPHLLEIFFLLATLYFSFRMSEQYQPHFLIYAIIFAGLATTTKFGGIFMIPVVWCSYLYSKREVPCSELISYLKSKNHIIYFFSSLLIIISIFIPTISLLLYSRIQKKLFIFGIKSLDDFLRFRNFRIVLFSMALLFTGSIFWLFLNRLSNKFSKEQYLAKKYSYIFSINKSILVLFYISISIFFIFLMCNPYYIIFPRSTVKEMGFQFAKSTMGTSYDPGLTKPIFDRSGIVWFQILFDNYILNAWFGLLFLCYLVMEFIKLKRNLISNKTFVFQRGLLLLYCIFLFLTLFLFLAHRAHHYLLPIGMVLGILISFGIFEAIKQAVSTFLKWSLVLFFSLSVILGFYTRSERFISICNYFSLRPYDIGIIAGKWLENKYSEDAIIWKDIKSFYIPPKFKNVFSMSGHENIEEKLSEINAKVLIITSKFDSDFKNVEKINNAIKSGILKDYKQIKLIKHYGVLNKSEYGMYKEVYIYAK